MKLSGNRKNAENRRMKAVDLLEKGTQPCEVARQLKVARRTVRKWKARYRSQGIEGIKARPKAGRPAYLTAGQKERLKAALIAGAEQSGFETDLWTCARVQQTIEKLFGVTYHVDYIGRLLRSLGFSPQRPQRQAAERDEKQIKDWLHWKWPAIKKKPTGSMPA